MCQPTAAPARAFKIQELLDQNKGELPSFAWPGGYPLFYVSHGGVECPACANKLVVPENIGFPDEPLDYDVNYEDFDLTCDECGEKIEAAYK